MIINKKATITSVTATIMIIMALPLTCFIAQVQADTSFGPTEKFEIPANNSTISFSAVGTYTRASLENSTWNFVGLILNFSQGLESLKVSAQDSNVVIRSCQKFNTTFAGARIRYYVEGQGKQTFNIDAIPKGGEWSISFNGVFKGENDGWSVSREGTVTVTGATSHSNVTIAYYTFLDSIMDNSNLPVYQRHSVAIATAVAVGIAVVLAVAIRRKRRKASG